jgi:hypothetical protein
MLSNCYHFLPIFMPCLKPHNSAQSWIFSSVFILKSFPQTELSSECNGKKYRTGKIHDQKIDGI